MWSIRLLMCYAWCTGIWTAWGRWAGLGVSVFGGGRFPGPTPLTTGGSTALTTARSSTTQKVRCGLWGCVLANAGDSLVRLHLVRLRSAQAPQAAALRVALNDGCAGPGREYVFVLGAGPKDRRAAGAVSPGQDEDSIPHLGGDVNRGDLRYHLGNRVYIAKARAISAGGFGGW